MPLRIDEDRIDHIFRDAVGHFRQDTPANRQALLETAGDSGNFVGRDRFGNEWFAALQTNGTQIWVQVREGKVKNGGVNVVPRSLQFGTARNPVRGRTDEETTTVA